MVPTLLTAEFGGVFLFFLLFAVGAPLVLWSLIDSETEQERTEHTDWERAERRDTRDDDRY